MASVMQRAVQIDDGAVAQEQQIVTQLKVENNTLREILHIAVSSSSNMYRVDTVDGEAQTEEDEHDEAVDLDSSIITVKEFDISSKDEKSDSVMQSSSDSKNEVPANEQKDDQEKTDESKDLIKKGKDVSDKLQPSQNIDKDVKIDKKEAKKTEKKGKKGNK